MSPAVKRDGTESEGQDVAGPQTNPAEAHWFSTHPDASRTLS